jgi:ribosome-associated protein
MATRKSTVRKAAPARGGARAPRRPRSSAAPKKAPRLDPSARVRSERAVGRPAPAGAAAEKAAPAPALPPPTDADSARPRAVAIARAGLDKKAEDVLVLDVRGLTSYADYFVLMTADSDRQAGAIADQVDHKLKEGGAQKVGVEGYETGRWILIDYGDVVAHVFSREARGFYDLEGLWADAPRFTVTDEG